MKSKIDFFLLPLLLCSIIYCFYRDVQIEKKYPQDLRNRVVGSRLQADGKSPYFYQWNPQDGSRYYDPPVILNTTFSPNTATPFFNSIFSPVANFSQHAISFYWLVFQYLAMLMLVGILFLLQTNKFKRYAILVSATLLLYSNTWLNLIETGQYYLLMSLLIALIYFCLKKYQTNAFWLLPAGLFVAFLIGIKPTTGLLLLPLCIYFFYSKTKLGHIGLFFSPLIIITIFCVANSRQQSLWSSYFSFVDKNIEWHLQTNTPQKIILKDSAYTILEGWDYNKVEFEKKRTPQYSKRENGNIFLLFPKQFTVAQKKALLSSLLLVCCIVLTFFFVKRGEIDINSVFFFAIVLLLLSDFLMPVFRHQYYAVQWFFPALLFVAINKNKQAMVLIFTLLVANIYCFKIIPLQFTICEFLLILLFYNASVSKNNHAAKINLE